MSLDKRTHTHTHILTCTNNVWYCDAPFVVFVIGIVCVFVLSTLFIYFCRSFFLLCLAHGSHSFGHFVSCTFPLLNYSFRAAAALHLIRLFLIIYRKGN